MKSQKLFLPAIILGAAVLVIAVFSFLCCIAVKPKITEAEFPFSITYEMDGETCTIQDVYKAYYVGDIGKTKGRNYHGEIGDMGENTTFIVLLHDEDERIQIHTKFYPDYLMGDTDYDYFDDKPFAPEILYSNPDETEFFDEAALEARGVKLIDWEYPTPIQNSFVFSHIALLCNDVVLPSLGIAALTWLAMIIFVKKEKDGGNKVLNVISLILSLLIVAIFVPFVTFCTIFIDAVGSNEDIISQTMYFVPALTLLGMAASAALRRKCYSLAALFVPLAGPAVFGIQMVILYFAEML